jgi:uncharacterized protein (DUF433 family)
MRMMDLRHFPRRGAAKTGDSEYFPTGQSGEHPDGTARIDETRYKVLHLAAEHYHHGWTAEALLRQHPDLRPGRVYSALAYFHDHHAELLAQLKGSLEAVERIRPMQPFSRGGC